MFKTLFRYPRVLSHHANGPLAQERSTFLSHLQTQGVPRSTLLRCASQLLLVAGLLPRRKAGQVARSEIARCAQRWAQRQRRRGRARTVQWAAQRFEQAARAWCSFLGWLKETPPPRRAYPSQLSAWASFVQAEGLSESTAHNYCWWIDSFLQWLAQQEVPLRQVTLAVVDGFMRYLSSKPLSRASLATAAKVLRRFAHYAYAQGWWPRDWAPAILSPRLFRQEDLPLGPAWTDLRRLIAANDGARPLPVRNRAILLLLAVYGLRSGHDENGQLVVGIDDKELSLEEFGRMLTIYAGWGMRIEFGPENQLHRRPALEVRGSSSQILIGCRHQLTRNFFVQTKCITQCYRMGHRLLTEHRSHYARTALISG